jgi:DNA-binding transcriptional LysR family regulator
MSKKSPLELPRDALQAYPAFVVELRHLVYFRTVAQLGSIAKAAAALHMTQPTLSRQIAQLERTLGHQLLRRTSRGASLTPAGEGLRRHVGAILELADRIPDVLDSAERGGRTVHIGIPPGLPHQWFEAFQAALGDAVPNLRISVREATSDEQRGLLQNGVIDIGLLHAEPRELRSVRLFTQRFGCAVRDHSRFDGRRSLTLDDLAGLRVLAHSAQESPGEEARLRATAQARGARIDWLFRRFSEHGELVANSAQADVVLVSAASSRRHFPAWRWIPLDRSDEVNSLTRTWAAWADPDLLDLAECLAAMQAASACTESAEAEAEAG